MSAEVLENLGKLQEVADRIDALEAKRKEAASDLERIEANLEKSREQLDAKVTEHRALDMERRKKELKLKEEKERQARIKGRVGEVKTGREYQAVLAETNAIKTSISSIEETLLKDMETVETAAKEIDESKERIAAIEKDAAEAKSAYEGAVSETEKEIAENRKNEAAMIATLPAEVAARYQLIRSRRGGVAVVEARNEACTACYMHIPPQTYIEIVRRSAVLQCPNCHRILIPPRDNPEDAAGEASEEATEE